MNDPNSAFIYEPAADYPGWHTWNLADQTLFNPQTMGRMLVRRENSSSGDALVRLRMFPERRHGNLLEAVHGGVTLGLIDIALFATMRVLTGNDPAGAVTLDLSAQFIGAGRLGQPLDALGEILRETHRMVFLRGTIEQDSHLVAAYSGTVRKPSGR